MTNAFARILVEGAAMIGATKLAPPSQARGRSHDGWGFAVCSAKTTAASRILCCPRDSQRQKNRKRRGSSITFLTAG